MDFHLDNIRHIRSMKKNYSSRGWIWARKSKRQCSRNNGRIWGFYSSVHCNEMNSIWIVAWFQNHLEKRKPNKSSYIVFVFDYGFSWYMEKCGEWEAINSRKKKTMLLFPLIKITPFLFSFPCNGHKSRYGVHQWLHKIKSQIIQLNCCTQTLPVYGKSPFRLKIVKLDAYNNSKPNAIRTHCI